MSDEGWTPACIWSPSGKPAVVENGTGAARSWKIECGDFGTITFTVPKGGAFHFNPGSIAPKAAFTDATVDITPGGNVTRFD